MASVIDELKELAEQRKPSCRTKVALESLNDVEVAEQLEQALMAGAFSYSIVRDFFKRRDILISNDALADHKRGMCKCPIKLLKS